MASSTERACGACVLLSSYAGKTPPSQQVEIGVSTKAAHLAGASFCELTPENLPQARKMVEWRMRQNYLKG